MYKPTVFKSILSLAVWGISFILLAHGCDTVRCLPGTTCGYAYCVPSTILLTLFVLPISTGAITYFVFSYFQKRKSNDPPVL
jgi:hypothetical protein